MTLVYCVGTATEVGKTWVGAATLAGLRAEAGLRVSARKPVQSFEPGSGPTDGEVLAAATGERPDEVCPPERSFGVPMAPPMAAAVLGRPCPTVAELVAALDWPAGADLRWVEGVGGPRSPIAADGDGVDLAAALAPDLVVLVADAGLGTINAVRLCVEVLDRWPVAVHLNRYDETDDLHRRNRAWLGDLTTTTSPSELGVVVSSYR